jgi:hypothetical protein
MGNATQTGLQNSTVFAFNNLTTTAQLVAPVNPNRTKISFSNPGLLAAPADVVVFPVAAYAGLPQPGGNSVALTPTTLLLGGGFRVFASGGIVTITGQAAKQAWQALALSGSGNPLTVMEET